MILKKIAIFPIRVYQLILRPILPSTCLFSYHGKESCSEYMITVIKNKGVIKGFFLGIYRIIRCHPWQKNFNDPV